jgi:hypothetical protein
MELLQLGLHMVELEGSEPAGVTTKDASASRLFYELTPIAVSSCFFNQ